MTPEWQKERGTETWSVTNTTKVALLSHPECLDRGLPQYRQNLVLSLSFFFSSLLWFSRRKAALAQEKFPTLNAVISLFFSESSSCDLFTININKCCKVSAKQLQCISCYSADLSWWTSVLGMYFQNKVSIFYCHVLYSVWNHPMKNKTEKLRSVDTNW